MAINMTISNYAAISLEDTAADIVKKDYRTAAVFSHYGIEFCCGVRWPLSMVCEMKAIPADDLFRQLQQACRTIRVSNRLPFENWSIDFLADYIIHVHHQYLKQFLPQVEQQLEKFIEEHKKKYPDLAELGEGLRLLTKNMMPHLQQEEEILFPYLRQVAHAYTSRESYAVLLIRTLRKPVESIMQDEHSIIETLLNKFRSLTQYYTAPPNACTSHRLSYSMLQELDDDLVQHLYLENGVLFPKAIAMEKELLGQAS